MSNDCPGCSGIGIGRCDRGGVYEKKVLTLCIVNIVKYYICAVFIICHIGSALREREDYPVTRTYACVDTHGTFGAAV